MDPGGGKLDGRHLLENAKKLLHAGDFVGSKCFAERALESDPLLDGIDQTLAIADVLLASQRSHNNRLDYYSILQLPCPSDSLAIKHSYRRLSILLSPDHNRSPLAIAALRFVLEAYSILSDPAKKSQMDSEMQGSHAQSPAFWTYCPSCFHVFEYDRLYVDRLLRCSTCRRPFRAAEMAAEPPIVPGTDMYYCTWGFFPLGFQGGPTFELPAFEDGWKPFDPMRPVWETQEKPFNAVPMCAKKEGGGRGRKAVAKKRAGNCGKMKAFSGAENREGYNAETGMGSSHLDIVLHVAEDALENLPFLS